MYTSTVKKLYCRLLRCVKKSPNICFVCMHFKELNKRLETSRYGICLFSKIKPAALCLYCTISDHFHANCESAAICMRHIVHSASFMPSFGHMHFWHFAHSSFLQNHQIISLYKTANQRIKGIKNIFFFPLIHHNAPPPLLQKVYVFSLPHIYVVKNCFHIEFPDFLMHPEYRTQIF
jgi:hypothetical protein